MRPAAVIRAAVDAHLHLIEWGSDVHAPPGSADLDDLSALTIESGIQTSSYGTYWRAGASARAEIPDLIRAAQSLQTSRLRIWTADSVGVIDRRIVDDVRAIADEAQMHGMEVALEFHEGTATDSAARVLQLLESVGRPNLTSYWQPTPERSVDEQLRDLDRLVDHVSALHVFGLGPAGQIAPLSAQAALWDGALAVAHAARHRIDLLFEFVPGDDPTGLQGQAAQLSAIAQEVRTPSGDRSDAAKTSSSIR